MKGETLCHFRGGGGQYQEGFVKEIPFELDIDYQLVSDVRIKNILSQKGGKKKSLLERAD